MTTKAIKYLLILFNVLLCPRLYCQLFEVDTLLYNGDPEKIINLVILPDGYTESELDKFVLDAIRLTDDLFNQSPFQEYQSYFNVFLVKVPSAESGATHSGTATDVNEPVFPVKTVNNRFGSRFDFAGIHRLLVPTNAFEISNILANNFPLYDQILILVNSPFYGGSGGANATTSLDASASEIAFHELGHSFAGLSDEYYAGDQYARESPNMTADINPESVKWKNWYGDESIGIFQHCCGGNSAMWYRPHNNCKMRFLDRPFCAVCSQQIVESIHFRTNPIYDFQPLETTLEYLIPITFRLDLLKPSPNSLEVKWLLNDEETGITSDSFTLTEEMLLDGLNLVQSSVEDRSEFLRVDNHSAKHLYLTSWEIEKSTTGIDLIGLNKLELKISPNPTSDFIQLQLFDLKDRDYSIHIYDLRGRLLINKKIVQPLFSLDLSSLSAHNYVLSILENNLKLHSVIITKI